MSAKSSFPILHVVFILFRDQCNVMISLHIMKNSWVISTDRYSWISHHNNGNNNYLFMHAYDDDILGRKRNLGDFLRIREEINKI